jgi:hypothetical protein
VLPIALILCFAVMYGAVVLALHGVVAAAASREEEASAERKRAEEREELWRRYAHLGPYPIAALDLREAGWSDERAKSFLAEHFGGRTSIRLDELRPFLADVTVGDVVTYRAERFAAAARYEPIRQTWINVDKVDRAGMLPAELRALVVERERQSGKLIWASDLLPYVGRPVVRDLLEQKLADCGAVPPTPC